MANYTSANNKRIAKNTMMLYLRMLFTLVIGLYTSRVVLNGLGFSDYGIYNVVGGVVTMLSFLNVGMSGASQRFIVFELGKGDVKSVNNVFCQSVLAHVAITVIVLFILESVGLWLLNYKLNIPYGREVAANWVFQCSMIMFCFSIISVPYSSCIIAHERMDVYAYISIFDALFKLFVAYLISVSESDRLIIYSVLLLFCQIIISISYYILCKKWFKECVFHLKIDKQLFKKIFSFATWGCIGNMGFSLKDQCSNILLNLFFGTTVNAARGIAMQVNGIISTFASNFTVALNPQITKQYSSGNYETSMNLATSGARYAFFLMSLVSIPFLINEHFVLELWLGKVPDYTDEFVYIVVLSSVLYSISHPISTSILATGNVKWFQILLSVTLLIEVPLAYIILLFGGKPYHAVMPMIFTVFLSLFLRIVIINRMLPIYSIKYFIFGVIFRCVFVYIIGFSLSYFIHSFFEDGYTSLITTTLLSVTIVLVVIFICGLNNKERHFLWQRISYIIKHIRNENEQ